MEAFDNCFSDYALLTYLVQDTINIIYNESLEIIKEKILSILKALNIIEQSSNLSNFTNINNACNANKDSDSTLLVKQKEKKENFTHINTKQKNGGNNIFETLDYEKFLCKFRLIFQEYFSGIFQHNTNEFNFKIKNKMNDLILKDEIYKNFDDNKKNLIEEDLNSKSFGEFSISAMKLCLYMHLHEPKLNFNLPSCFNENIKRKLCFFYYKKDEFTNIEGFPKDKCCCVIILPCPVLRSNYSYQGIKPAVYIVGNATHDILSECDKNLNSEKALKQKEKALNDSGNNLFDDKKEYDKEHLEKEVKENMEKKEDEKVVELKLEKNEDTERKYENYNINSNKVESIEAIIKNEIVDSDLKNNSEVVIENKKDLVEEKKYINKPKEGKLIKKNNIVF